MLVTENGWCYGWGSGADGKIGAGCYADQLHPARIFLYGEEAAAGGVNEVEEQKEGEKDDAEWGCAEKSGGSSNDSRLLEEEARRMENGDGQGAYSFAERYRPVTGDPVVKAAAGYAHSAFLTRSGRLYTSGCGVSGQLAQGCQMPRPPRRRGRRSRRGTEAEDENTDGDAWGDGEDEQKDGVPANAAAALRTPIPTVVSLVPRPVQWAQPGAEAASAVAGEAVAGPLPVVTDVACGDHHTVVIVAAPEGSGGAPRLFGWGLNTSGQLGGEEQTAQLAQEEQLWPQEIPEGLGSGRVACGPSTTAVVVDAV